MVLDEGGQKLEFDLGLAVAPGLRCGLYAMSHSIENANLNANPISNRGVGLGTDRGCLSGASRMQELDQDRGIGAGRAGQWESGN